MPLISVVSSCAQVAPFLSEFIVSVDDQTIDERRLEIVIVDTGSCEKTSAALEAWAARRPEVVRVIHREGATQGQARNLGIEAATGEWVTFPDPDDVLAADYFGAIQTFIERHPGCDMLAANHRLLDDPPGQAQWVHPLRYQFRRDAKHNLAIRDRFFHGKARTAFLRRDRLISTGLRFDPRIRSEFSDGYFCSRYLIELAEPIVGFVKSAGYLQRTRHGGPSTYLSERSDAWSDSSVLRLSYLDLLRRAKTQHGSAPLWLQNFVLFELDHFIGREDPEVRTLLPVDAREEFHQLMAEIAAELDAVAIQSYRCSRMRSVTRDLLQHGWAGQDWTSAAAVIIKRDVTQGLIQLRYRYVGSKPSESLLLGTRSVVPLAAKTRDVRVQDRVVLHERILWAPLRRLRLQVNGRFLPVVEAEDDLPFITIEPRLVSTPTDPRKSDATTSRQLGPTDRVAARAATSRRARSQFADAWVLMDRVHNSDDSAEHLFTFLRKRHPRINAWFVIEKETLDFKRLRKEYGTRVVAHGSVRWKALLLNAKYVISSHADRAVVDPPALQSFGPTRSRFVFLQHGVTKDDLSGWLNHRNLDLMVTSTRAEYTSIVADHTAYRYTTKDVVLTGLPRFDRLFRTSGQFPAAKRDLLLLSPTWRNQLVEPLTQGSQRRIAVAGILETPYMKAWTGLLRDPALADAASRHSLAVAILPHPNMEGAFDMVDLPDHVDRLSFDGAPDPREIFSRAAVLVTDYSSTAFDAAYISRPVVYYQFDSEEHSEARHVGLAGYFDYTRHGFGPVTHTHQQALTEIVETLDHGREPRSPWAERMATTFQYRDNRNCERVVAQIGRIEERARLDFAQD